MISVMQITLLLLIFGSVALISAVAYPALVKRIDTWHQKRTKKLAPQLDQMWLSVSSNRFTLINIFLPLTLGIAGAIILQNPVGAVIGIFVGLAIPFIVIKQMEARRRNKLGAQLVDGIMLLSSSLKAGLSLVQALEVVVEEMSPPISQEIGLVIRENKMGVPLEEGFQKLNKRVHVDELELLVDAILVARETGGDLTKVFGRLVTTIRDRRKLKEKIKTLTLQGRLQGILMSALPFVFIIYILTLNRNHFEVMLQTDTGRLLLILVVVFQSIAMFLIRRFSTMKLY